MDWSFFFEKWIWFGLAAIGFGILFNVPKRTIVAIFCMGALGGALKLLVLYWLDNVIIATLTGAMLVGFLSVFAAHFKHSPPFVFAIPAVIPMVPGMFAYKTMKGVIALTANKKPEEFIDLLNNTVNNGLKTMFILLAIAIGVFAPMLLTRRDSAKELKVPSVLLKNDDSKL